MWTNKTKIYFLLYRLTAAWLPISQRCKFAKWVRGFWAEKICTNVGKNVNIERYAFFTPSLSIGENSGLGICCEINGPVFIGKDVMMGPEVIIYTSGHEHTRIDIPMNQQGMQIPKPVYIDDDVWLGRRCIILPGVHIGKGSIIAAGAVVTKDVREFSVAGGVPARIIRSRKGEKIKNAK